MAVIAVRRFRSGVSRRSTDSRAYAWAMWRRSGAFERGLGLIALVALAVRGAYAVWNRAFLVQGDAMTFHQVAQHLADGAGFIQPFTVPVQPTAEHPPLWEVVLAGADLIGANGYLSHRLLGALIGTVTVVLSGLLARAAAGPRAGLIAAAIAAVYPILVTADGSLMSETLYGALVAGALLVAARLRRRPSVGAALGFGALVALAALTRGEGLGLLVLLGVPLAWWGASTWGRRAGLFAAMAVAFVAVLAPWTIRNLATFKDPVLISTNSSGVWIGANCPAVYSGPLIGSWRFQCYLPRRRGEDESQYFTRNRDAGIRYLRHHTDRLPDVMLNRVERLLDVGHVDQALFLNAAEGRPARPMRWAIRSAWVVMLLAIAGLVVLARRRSDVLWILLAPIVLVLVTALATYGNTRFRQGAEPSLVVLAGIALEAGWAWLSVRRAARTSAPASPVAPFSA